ncbi:PREDICTED: eukaryotic translation initiation factor 4E-like [Diuraphis noxia]|uniref:eukaryotic translation initiation factor 4E-like n=1 Tax=Diuraphis noxia TaxID=143948 RepID=UPI0007635DA3|nr:PREDICTED: eukaryotic translation initiation factor 4E-like [Diuraphis noxia]
MEYNLKKSDQLEYPEIITELNQTIISKSNIYDEYQKLVKNTNENINNSTESLYTDVAMVYPISSWTFWYRNPLKFNLKDPWEESLTKIGTVCDVTHLWKVLNHIIQPSVKSLNMCLFVFNEKSIPAWEHKSNENAGRWIIILRDNHNLHNTWNNMVLQIVGDKFEPVITDINGIGLYIKPVNSKITVWTKKITLSNYKNIINIGIMSRQTIGPKTKSIYYLMHNRSVT